ncbi:thioredoxin domain-containing protein [Rubrolithibacter danxiaensis]|uniref:thioredoxin domain-containing protein n=1 Tax=Rubrolithibacter danxiaensis TaxID=3390805 RepID=UPI003BF90357
MEIVTNRLINETSPYLLQHAHNPVDWYPWGEDALKKAKKENKLILVSIGYSACHWCHVMEHESFEDPAVAKLMNEHFVCIKIDREERPDIDQIYMYAVQLMTGSGGWPLNCFCLPDQRPIYGGTYFRKNDWMNLLGNLSSFWAEKPEEAVEYAVRLTEGIQQSETIEFIPASAEYTKEDLTAVFEPWKRYFDFNEGGHNRAPKFPLPNNWQFILRYAHLMKDDTAHVITRLTLQKMAFGGIYDHIGGGFARYSVDGHWHVPHFEKMLYDNAQLISLYSEAYQYCRDELYKEIVYQSIDWVIREIASPEGGFYSALDADSEGVEGKFYTFTKEELKDILGEKEKVFSTCFNVTEEGNWPEEHTNVLIRKYDDETVAETLGIEKAELKKIIEECKAAVFRAREQRVHPGLDNKILASWNGMMLKAFTDAYRVFDEPEFLSFAIENARFILKYLKQENGSLKRVFKPADSSITNEVAFLDDYAFVIEAFISLYEVTFEESWLYEAKSLAEYVITNFDDPETGMLFYTSSADEQLIARKHEIMDNVIPGSNSVMANNLFKLGHFFDEDKFLRRADQMLVNVFPRIKTYGSAYSNWANLLLNKVFGIYEIAITGPLAEEKRRELEHFYIPDKIILGGSSGTLPLLQDKFSKDSKIFVCKNRTCQLPVTEVSEALKQID